MSEGTGQDKSEKMARNCQVVGAKNRTEHDVGLSWECRFAFFLRFASGATASFPLSATDNVNVLETRLPSLILQNQCSTT